MATNTPPHHPKIHVAGEPMPDEGGFWVVYGKGGIGKTTSACQGGGLLLDCTGGGKDQSIDSWRVHNTADLDEALTYLEKLGGHAYRLAILDSFDDLYRRTLKPAKDERAAHKAAQAVVLPLLARFWSLPFHRILIINEKVKTYEAGAVTEDGERVRQVTVDIEMNLPPKLSQLVDDRADAVIRAENKGHTDEHGAPLPTTIRVRRVTEARVNVQAKTRTDLLTNGMKLTDALAAIGAVLVTPAEQAA